MISAFIYPLRSLWESLNYAQTLFDFLAGSFDRDMTGAVTKSLNPPLPKMAAIKLNVVTYPYPNNQKQALTEISCVFSPGLTAIIGTNGAGKSTLVKLAAGLVAPTHHMISHAGLRGGGTGNIPRPDEMSLTHRGVLILDDYLESCLLEVLVQDYWLTVSRSYAKAEI